MATLSIDSQTSKANRTQEAQHLLMSKLKGCCRCRLVHFPEYLYTFYSFPFLLFFFPSLCWFCFHVSLIEFEKNVPSFERRFDAYDKAIKILLKTFEKMLLEKKVVCFLIRMTQKKGFGKCKGLLLLSTMRQCEIHWVVKIRRTNCIIKLMCRRLENNTTAGFSWWDYIPISYVLHNLSPSFFSQYYIIEPSQVHNGNILSIRPELLIS